MLLYGLAPRCVTPQFICKYFKRNLKMPRSFGYQDGQLFWAFSKLSIRMKDRMSILFF